MTRLTRSDLDALPAYVPGRSAGDVARELGISQAIKLASNEVPYGPLPGVVEVRGAGLMLACDLAAGGAPGVVARALAEERLVLNATGPATLRFLPPLVVGEEEVDDALARLGRVLS